MHNLKVPKTNVIVTLLKICRCNKSIDNVVDCNVVYARNPDLPQKALSELSQSYGIGGHLK